MVLKKKLLFRKSIMEKNFAGRLHNETALYHDSKPAYSIFDEIFRLQEKIMILLSCPYGVILKLSYIQKEGYINGQNKRKQKSP